MTVRGLGSSRNDLRSRYASIYERVTPWWVRLRARFEVDTRSLAAVRIALGCILLIDLVHRAPYIEQFYTDDGAYPLAAYEATSRYAGLSIHALSGELWVQQLLFVIAGLFAVAFLFGYRTRLVGFVSLVLLFSLHGRNPAVLNGGDRLFRVLLFVALVTPLGERWSVDALRRGTARSRVVGVGTAALLVQPLVVFTASAIEKSRGERWFAGEALEIAMYNDVMTILLGNVLVEFPTLMTVLNYGWVILLGGAVVLLFAPVGRVRTLAALAYMGAFAGMVVTMTVGLFPLLLATAVLPYLTPSFWAALARRIPDDWYDRRPSRSMLGPLGRPPIERRLVSALRARGHRLAASSIVATARSALTVAGLCVLVWMLLFSTAYVTEYEVPEPIDNQHLNQQRWGLYAPDPSTAYSWYLVEAERPDGSSIDARDGGPVTFDRPPDASAEYETFRHRKFMQTVRRSGENAPGTIVTSYAAWACEQPDGAVERVTIHRMYQSSPIDGELEQPHRLTVIEYDCDAD